MSTDAIHWQNLSLTTFLRHGFPVLDDTGQAWLRPGEDIGSEEGDHLHEPRQFRGHSSFLKVSKAISHSRSKEERESFKALHVSDEERSEGGPERPLDLIGKDLAPFRSTHLGSQLCSDIELLAMLGSAQDGYYPRLRVEKLPGEVLPEMEVVGDDDPRAALESAWSGEPQALAECSKPLLRLFVLGGLHVSGGLAAGGEQTGLPSYFSDGQAKHHLGSGGVASRCTSAGLDH
eukprot:g33433.t1